jgi:hypothetical protein
MASKGKKEAPVEEKNELLTPEPKLLRVKRSSSFGINQVREAPSEQATHIFLTGRKQGRKD